MIKMLVSDIDGTILNENCHCSENVKKCINNLQNNGVKVVIATGRMYKATTTFLKEINVTNPVICYQGAVIRNVSTDNKFLYKSSLPQNLVLPIINYLRSENIHTNLYLDDTLYVEKITDEAKSYTKFGGISFDLIDKFEDLDLSRLDKMLFISDDRPKFLSILNKLTEKYKDELSIIQSRPNYGEIVPKNVSKGTAIKFLAKRWNIDIKDVLAIGDQDNDIDMIKTAGIGVAMGNSSENLKLSADFITKSVDDDGFVYAVEKFIGVNACN